MEMDGINPELLKAGIDLGSILAKNTATAISTKIRAIKTTDDKDKIIGQLEEIINDLISDKNQLIQLVQSYEEKFITQKISNEDIEYITESLVPLLEELFESSNDESASKAREAINAFKPILSKDLFNIMQLLGFNFNRAIGEPLTGLVSALISSKTPTSLNNIDLQALQMKKEIEYLKVAQDKEAYKRLLKLSGIEE
jgi:hypothetical protein